MARILIGNIKGPKGDTGPQGKQGPTGPQGPKGDTGPMPALINNAATTSAGVGALDAAMGKTLSDQIAVLNSDAVRKIPNASDLPDLTALMEYTEDWNSPLLFGIDWQSNLSPDGNSTIGIMTKGAAWAFSHSGNIYYTRESDSNPNEWKSKILTTLEYNDTPGDTIQDAIHAKAKFINQNAVCVSGILPGGWQGHEGGFTLFYKTTNIIILLFIGQYEIYLANYIINTDTISDIFKITATAL